MFNKFGTYWNKSKYRTQLFNSWSVQVMNKIYTWGSRRQVQKNWKKKNLKLFKTKCVNFFLKNRKKTLK